MLDVKDRKLLRAIDLNARLSTAAIGRHIGLSQESVHYRLARLQEQKIVTGFVSLLNFGALGYTGHAVYARFHNVSPKQKDTVFTELSKRNCIYWIAEFGGRFDVAIGILAKNIFQFHDILSDISTKYKDALKDFTVAIRVDLNQYPRDYLVQDTPPDNPPPTFGRYDESHELDEIDFKILEQLSDNARAPCVQIAKEIGISASTITNRIRRMEKQKTIQGYSALIHCEEMDFQSFQLFIKAKDLTEDKRHKLFSYCNQHKNITFCIETIGEWNFEIIYELKDQKELQKEMMEIRKEFADVIDSVESVVLFNHYVKYSPYSFSE